MRTSNPEIAALLEKIRALGAISEAALLLSLGATDEQAVAAVKFLGLQILPTSTADAIARAREAIEAVRL